MNTNYNWKYLVGFLACLILCLIIYFKFVKKPAILIPDAYKIVETPKEIRLQRSLDSSAKLNIKYDSTLKRQYYDDSIAKKQHSQDAANWHNLPIDTITSHFSIFLRTH